MRLEEQSELSEKYQVVRSYQMRLVILMADIKERNQARKNIKVLMPAFSGRASEYTLFKREFSSWSLHLTDTERRVSFLKAVESSEIRNKIASASNYKQMVRALDSYYGNSQMISSKLFAELQKLNKPSQHDFENENHNILKITSYLSFLESVGRKEISIFESQAICGLIRQASMEKYIEEVGDLEDTEGTAHFGLVKIRLFLDKLAQRND